MLPAELTQQFDALIQSRQFDRLESLLATATQQYPGEAQLPHLYGWLRTQQARYVEALELFREAVRLNPEGAGSWSNLGHLLLELDRPLEAIEALRTAVQLQPTFVPALANLGFALARLNWCDPAQTFLSEALRLDPTYIEARHHLAYVLMHLGKIDEAEKQFDEVLRQQPENAGFLSTFGLFREKQRRPEEATALFHRSIQLNPKLSEAWNNLGTINAAVWGNYPEALRCFEQTLTIKPQYADAMYHRGMVELTLGDYTRGWPDYEHRPTMWQKSKVRYSRPRWNGEPLMGQTILLHCEQGLGDTFQFIRYAQYIKNLGATVLCEVQPSLVNLLARTPGIDALIPDKADLPPHDYQIPLLSVAGLLGVPRQQPPYVFADPDRVEFWRPKIAAVPGYKIGVAWQGEPSFKYDWLRSVPLANFAPLAQKPGVKLISLQKHHGADQIERLRSAVPVIELQPEIDAVGGGAFTDTAAIMTLLDLVITSDTSIAHLAGSLGVPVWLATQFAPDWRWMTAREDSPWYPTMRLFRQTQVNHWDDVFLRMAASLSSLASSFAPQP